MTERQLPTFTDIPPQLDGESGDEYWRRVVALLRGEDVRSRADLRGWTGSPPFHLSREEKSR